MKQIGNVKLGHGANHVEGPYLASNRGVIGPLSVVVSSGAEALVYVFNQTELTQMKLQLDVVLQQTACQRYPIQKQVGAVKMKLQLDSTPGTRISPV